MQQQENCFINAQSEFANTFEQRGQNNSNKTLRENTEFSYSFSAIDILEYTEVVRYYDAWHVHVTLHSSSYKGYKIHVFSMFSPLMVTAGPFNIKK